MLKTTHSWHGPVWWSSGRPRCTCAGPVWASQPPAASPWQPAGTSPCAPGACTASRAPRWSGSSGRLSHSGKRNHVRLGTSCPRRLLVWCCCPPESLAQQGQWNPAKPNDVKVFLSLKSAIVVTYFHLKEMNKTSFNETFLLTISCENDYFSGTPAIMSTTTVWTHLCEWGEVFQEICLQLLLLCAIITVNLTPVPAQQQRTHSYTLYTNTTVHVRLVICRPHAKWKPDFYNINITIPYFSVLIFKNLYICKKI